MTHLLSRLKHGSFAPLLLLLVVSLSACGGGGGDSTSMQPPPAATLSRADAMRLATQSSFGASDKTVAAAQTQSLDAYLDGQFAAPTSNYGGFAYVAPTAPPDCKAESSNPGSAASICARDNYSLFQVQRKFFQNAMTGQDQLRQRVAFALGQIIVVSGTEINQAYGMAAYQQLLLDHAFGNFRDLLYGVTLSPAMGRYLDMVNNDKPDPVKGTEPNENYARELLQLFSIGVYELNSDGTQKLDGDGKPIPTYDQDIIEGFAHVFTGWTYAPRPGQAMKKHNPLNYEGQMQVLASNHDSDAKQLLDGTVLPAGQTPENDLNDAIDNIFRHPNVGPFIGKQLIQHLVTANPTPAYVGRVAAAFSDNGQGVRGDMKAVIRAILSDSEARGDQKNEPSYGHLREPALFITSLLRALHGSSDGVFPRSQSSAMEQAIFVAPSVFNFYPPDHTLPGDTLLSPESAILNSTSAINRANFVNTLVLSANGIAPDADVAGATGTQIDLNDVQALAANAEQLVDELARRLLGGTLSSTSRAATVQAVNAVAATDTLNRARTAVYLIALSPNFQVEQ
jgi:uncharacterized protein (DUF1800 family)